MPKFVRYAPLVQQLDCYARNRGDVKDDEMDSPCDSMVLVNSLDYGAKIHKDVTRAPDVVSTSRILESSHLRKAERTKCSRQVPLKTFMAAR